ncbi:uncharacterized protein LOC128546501 [Mercenaria mercenaria]|uniref:uncharacterized protein LOC128546501 n=1 Tax=Mercenaria mercenaria TaxID=6596 RepID=UPI00234EE2EF|nr:uncharacterized protein LOC128546501 [Mercenaria mercenaria]
MATGGFSTDILSDETFDLLCTVCKNKGKNTEAAKYCTDCADYYCLTCVKVHDDVPLLKGHKILDQGKAKTGTRKHLPVVPTERCDRHGHKPVDMYCQNHDNVGCAACMAVEHRSCKDIFYIPEFIQNNVTTTSTQNTKKKLESTEQTLKNHLQNLEKEKQNVLKRKSESIENVRKFRREVNERLDEMERNSVAEIEERYKAVIQQIEDAINALQENKKDVTFARDTLAAAGNNVSQVFVSIKKGLAAASKADKSLEERRVGNQDQEIIFTPDQNIIKMITELISLGQVTLKYNRKYLIRSDEQVKQKDTLLQTKGMKKFSVKIPSDKKDCDIFSSCFLSDGTVILSDYNNTNLKRLDSYNYSVRDHYVLPWTPWKVCSINNQEVAVSLWRMPEIQFVTIENKMTKKSTMKFDFNCYGLAYAGDILYISDRESTVYMYSLSGQKLMQCSDQTIKNAIYSLAVSKDGSKIYAAVPYTGLFALDNTGKVVKTFNNPMLNCAFDCYVTDRGSVLVCGVRSNNVLQFTPDGELMGEVVKSNRCRTVCCNQQMTKMIVGKMTNEIEVYDLV